MSALDPRIAALVEEARRSKLAYGVRVLASRESPSRVVVALGETHLKGPGASELGKRVVDAFELRGVESFDFRRVAAGRLLRPFILWPRKVLQLVTFGWVKGSTIYDAKELKHGETVALETTDRVPLSLHVGSIYLTAFFATVTAAIVCAAIPLVPAPVVAAIAALAVLFEAHMLLLVPAYLLRRWRWAWVINPAIAILITRDTLMVEGTLRMLRERPDARLAVVVMGRAHLAGYSRELGERGGFESVGP